MMRSMRCLVVENQHQECARVWRRKQSKMGLCHTGDTALRAPFWILQVRSEQTPSIHICLCGTTKRQKPIERFREDLFGMSDRVCTTTSAPQSAHQPRPLCLGQRVQSSAGGRCVLIHFHVRMKSSSAATAKRGEEPENLWGSTAILCHQSLNQFQRDCPFAAPDRVHNVCTYRGKRNDS